MPIIAGPNAQNIMMAGNDGVSVQTKRAFIESGLDITGGYNEGSTNVKKQTEEPQWSRSGTVNLTGVDGMHNARVEARKYLNANLVKEGFGRPNPGDPVWRKRYDDATERIATEMVTVAMKNKAQKK